MDDDRPPTTDHRPPKADDQRPTTNDQRRWTTSDHRPPTTDGRSATGGHRPSIREVLFSVSCGWAPAGIMETVADICGLFTGTMLCHYLNASENSCP